MLNSAVAMDLKSLAYKSNVEVFFLSKRFFNRAVFIETSSKKPSNSNRNASDSIAPEY